MNGIITDTSVHLVRWLECMNGSGMVQFPKFTMDIFFQMDYINIVKASVVNETNFLHQFFPHQNFFIILHQFFSHEIFCIILHQFFFMWCTKMFALFYTNFFSHQYFCIILHQFFSPKFLHCFTPIFFTKIFALFYTKIFALFYTKICALFYTNFFHQNFCIILHQFFLHQNVCFFTPNLNFFSNMAKNCGNLA